MKFTKEQIAGAKEFKRILDQTAKTGDAGFNGTSYMALFAACSGELVLPDGKTMKMPKKVQKMATDAVNNIMAFRARTPLKKQMEIFRKFEAKQYAAFEKCLPPKLREPKGVPLLQKHVDAAIDAIAPSAPKK